MRSVLLFYNQNQKGQQKVLSFFIPYLLSLRYTRLLAVVLRLFLCVFAHRRYLAPSEILMFLNDLLCEFISRRITPSAALQERANNYIKEFM